LEAYSHSSLLLLFSSSSATTAAAIRPDALGRRCIGQFLTNYTTTTQNNNEKAIREGNNTSETTNHGNTNKNNYGTSMLSWLSENTSCDLPSSEQPFVSSWIRKKKDRNNNSNRNIDGSLETFSTANLDNNERPYHVVMLLMEDHPIYHEIVTLSSGFLQAGMRVTIVYISVQGGNNNHDKKEQGKMAEELQWEIFQRIPLSGSSRDAIQQDLMLHSRAKESFRLVRLVLKDENNDSVVSEACKNDKTFPAAASPLDHCAIEIAPKVLKLLSDNIIKHLEAPKQQRMKAGSSNHTTVDRDDDDTANHGTNHRHRNNNHDFVLVMDAGFLGGFLFAEVERIPVVTIGSHKTLLLATDHEPNWSPSPQRTFVQKMDRIWAQRVYSFSLTRVFLKANAMRHSLGMGRLALPLEHFLPVVAVVLDMIPTNMALSNSKSKGGQNTIFDDEEKNIESTELVNNNEASHSYGRSYGYRVHNLQPLLPPCIPCLDQPTTSLKTKKGNDSFVILVAPKAGVSARWTRSLIRALSLTKQSLESYDECLFDRKTCQNGVVDFSVDWLAMIQRTNNETNFFPPVFPSFIHRVASVGLLDSALRNPNTILALIHCDSESNILASLGIQVICMSQNHQVPNFHSVSDVLHEKGYCGRSTNDENAVVDLDGDSHSRLLQESLGRDDDTMDPKEIATQLLRFLRKKSIGPPSTSTTQQTDRGVEKQKKEVASWVSSGMKRTITIVETAARVHRNNYWDNPRQMQQLVSREITKTLQQQANQLFQHVDNQEDHVQEEQDDFSVFVAWLIFWSTIVYIALKDSIAMKQWRQHRNHQYYRNGGSILDVISSRLRDIDDVWDMLLSWLSDLPTTKSVFDSRNEFNGPNERSEIDATKDEPLQRNTNPRNNHHGQIRKRRKVKTAR